MGCMRKSWDSKLARLLQQWQVRKKNSVAHWLFHIPQALERIEVTSQWSFPGHSSKFFISPWWVQLRCNDALDKEATSIPSKPLFPGWYLNKGVSSICRVWKRGEKGEETGHYAELIWKLYPGREDRRDLPWQWN